MVKRVQLSSDDSTYYTLPGNSGELSNEAGQLPDTIFGAEFESNHPGLIGWTVQANGIFKGFAGYEVKLLMTGTPTTFTNETATQIGSSQSYQINNAAMEIFDRLTTVAVKDNAVAVDAANIESIDYLFGIVTFASGYSVTGPVTISGKYLPKTAIAGSRTFTLTQTAAAVDNSTIPTVQANSGHRTFEYGLKTVALDISGVYALSNAHRANLVARSEFVVEINPDASSLAVARGFFRYSTQGQSGDVGALEEETVSLTLSVPDVEDMLRPFGWNIAASSTLNQSLQTAISAWQNNTAIYVKYLPNAPAGVKGSCIVTDISLNGGLESMNEFTVNLQGSGALSAVS